MARLALPTILLLAAALRLAWLGQMSLWMDEGFTAMVAAAPWGHMGSVAVTIEKHPIGSYIFPKLALVISDGEWALRWPSAIFGILTVLAFYPLARRTLGESGYKAIAATALSATLAFLVLANRDARSYSSAILGLTLATWAWTLALQKPAREGARPWAMWVAAGLAAVYCHYIAFVVLAWEWLVAVLTQPKARHWWATLPVVAVAYLPALPRLKIQASIPSIGHPDPGLSDLIDLYFAQTVGFTLNFSSILAWYGLALLGFVAALCGGFRGLRRPPEQWSPIHRVGMVYWGFVGTIVGVALLAHNGLFETKYFVLACPLFILVVTEGIFALPWASVRWTLLASLLLLNITSSLNAICQPEWQRQDFRAALEVVLKNCHPGDTLVLEPDWLEPVVRYYLGPRSDDLHLISVPPPKSPSFQASGLDPEHDVWVLTAALANPRSAVLPGLSAQRRHKMVWRSYRRSPLFGLRLDWFAAASGQRP